MLPPLLFSLVFLVPAWFLYRKGRLLSAIIPLVTSVLLLALTITIKVQDENKTQARRDVDTLLEQLAEDDIWLVNEVNDADQRLLLMSTAGQGLLYASEWYPEKKSAIDSTLSKMATWVTNTTRFPQWRKRSAWDEEVFFLAHAGAIIAHYQLVTGRENRAGELGMIGNHLATRLIRAQYKHLPSRPDEPFYRPADNAAAIYTLNLYDKLNNTGQYRSTFDDWNAYLTEELYYEESRLPCAAFSTTNRCQLEPSAVATGLFIAYRAAAQSALDTDIPYREWLHYFKGGISTPFTLNIRRDMRKDEQTRFCDLGALPLKCGRYEEEVGLWAAAEYGGGYTYFRLFAGVLFQHWFNKPVDYAAIRPARRVDALQKIAFRTLGESR